MKLKMLTQHSRSLHLKSLKKKNGFIRFRNIPKKTFQPIFFRKIHKSETVYGIQTIRSIFNPRSNTKMSLKNGYRKKIDFTNSLTEHSSVFYVRVLYYATCYCANVYLLDYCTNMYGTKIHCMYIHFQF